MVLWDVACLEIKVVHYFFVNVAEGKQFPSPPNKKSPTMGKKK